MTLSTINDDVRLSYDELVLIDKMAAAFAKHTSPVIPLNIDLWDVATIATYLKRSEHVVRQRLVCRVDFPPAIRLPSETGKRGHALYRARDVILWVEKYLEKR